MVAAACPNGLANVRALLMHDGIKTSLKNNVSKVTCVFKLFNVLLGMYSLCIACSHFSSGRPPWI